MSASFSVVLFSLYFACFHRKFFAASLPFFALPVKGEEEREEEEEKGEKGG